MKINMSIDNIFKYVICFFFCQNLCGQNDIKIIQSDQLNQLTINDTIFQKLSGNVIIEYKDFKINCANILMDEFKQEVKGWGNASIINDSIHCLTDSLIIKQFENKIYLYNNTLITINKMQINSNKIEYNYEDSELKYFDEGFVKTENYKIESNKLTHDIENEVSKFQNLVILNNNEYKILTDTLTYTDEIIHFKGETSIEDGDIIIDCMEGLLKKDDILKIYNQTTRDFDNREIKSDTLLIDIKNNENHFNNNVEIRINPETHIFSSYAKQNNQYLNIYNNSYIKLLNEFDSLLISGDTININNEEDKLDIINNVIIQGKELEGSCQSMQFQNEYKNIYMYTKPVLWINDIQITGSEIELYIEKNNLDSIYIPSNPFIISPYDSLYYYHQIKGKYLSGKFKEQKIEYAIVEGNSKMKYFEKHKSESSIIGLNNIEAGVLKLLFDNKKVEQVLCTNQIESNYIELDVSKRIKKNNKLLYFEDFELINRLFNTNKSGIKDLSLTD